MTTRRWLIAIVLLAAALRIWGIWFGLPFWEARPDEETAVAHATGVHHGRLNPQFFHWPSLTFYLFGAAYGVVATAKRTLSLPGMLTFAEHAIIGRVIVAAAGTLTVYLLFRIGRRLVDEAAGLIAALLLAVAILHVRDSHFAMTDVLMTCFVTASLLVLLTVRDGQVPRRCALAGLLAGLAASTKYSGLAIAPAMGIVQLQHFVEGARPWHMRAWAPSAAFTGALAAGFLIATPYALLDYRTFITDFSFDLTHLSTGHANLDMGTGWTYHLTRSLPYGAGPAIFAAAIPGVVLMLRRHTAGAMVVVGFGAAFYAALGSGSTVFFRYILPLVPLTCLAAAVAIRHLAPPVARYIGQPHQVVLAVLLALVAGPALVSSIWMDVLLARTDTRVLGGKWLTSHMQPDDSLYDAGNDYTRLTVPGTTHVWTYDESTNRFNDDPSRLPDWLVLQQSPLRAYTRMPAALRTLAMQRYELAHAVRATQGAAGLAVYDHQDAFFLPFNRFGTVARPGPTIMIYRRRE